MVRGALTVAGAVPGNPPPAEGQLDPLTDPLVAPTQDPAASPAPSAAPTQTDQTTTQGTGRAATTAVATTPGASPTAPGQTAVQVDPPRDAQTQALIDRLTTEHAATVAALDTARQNLRDTRGDKRKHETALRAYVKAAGRAEAAHAALERAKAGITKAPKDGLKAAQREIIAGLRAAVSDNLPYDEVLQLHAQGKTLGLTDTQLGDAVRHSQEQGFAAGSIEPLPARRMSAELATQLRAALTDGLTIEEATALVASAKAERLADEVLWLETFRLAGYEPMMALWRAQEAARKPPDDAPAEVRATPFDPKKQVDIEQLLAAYAYDPATNPHGWRADGWQVALLREADRVLQANPNRRGQATDGKISVAELQQYLYSPEGGKFLASVILAELSRSFAGLDAAQQTVGVAIANLRPGLRDAATRFDADGNQQLTNAELTQGTQELRKRTDPDYEASIQSKADGSGFVVTYRDSKAPAKSPAVSHETPNLWVPNQEAVSLKASIARFTGEQDPLRVGGVSADAVGLSFNESQILFDSRTATPVVVSHGQFREDLDVIPDVVRKDFFRQETSTGFLADGRRVTITSASPRAYEGTGRDQGHQMYANSAASYRAMHASTRMSNMSAQTPLNNRQVWRTLEDRTHQHVVNGSRIVDFTGSLMNDTMVTGTPVRTLRGPRQQAGTPGVNAKDEKGERIDVREPSDSWKVVLVQTPVHNDEGRVTGWALSVEAYIVPNLEILPATEEVVHALLDNRFGLVDYDKRVIRDPNDPTKTTPFKPTDGDLKNLAEIKRLQTLMGTQQIPVRVSVREIERRTGLRFFEGLPADVRLQLAPLLEKAEPGQTLILREPLLSHTPDARQEHDGKVG